MSNSPKLLSCILTHISLLFFLLGGSKAYAQKTFICNYNGENTSREVANGTFKVDSASLINEKAAGIVAKILDLANLGASDSIIVQEVNTVNNACALIRDGKRYILFKQSFIEYVDTATNSSYAMACILAHEIAHHVLGHTVSMDNTKRLDYELKADYWSGMAAYLLEANRGDAEAAVETYGNQNATKTHPARYDRMKAVQAGYTFAEKKYPRKPKDPSLKKELYPTFTSKGIWKPSDQKIKINKSLKLLQFEIYGPESEYIKEFDEQNKIYYYQLNPHAEGTERNKPVFNVVLENSGSKDIVITKVIYRVHHIDSVAGGMDGPLNPAAKYQHTLQLRCGDQEFVLVPPFKIEAGSVGNFLLELSTNYPGAGLTWQMTVYLIASDQQGGVSTDKFELIMTGPLKW